MSFGLWDFTNSRVTEVFISLFELGDMLHMISSVSKIIKYIHRIHEIWLSKRNKMFDDILSKQVS